jgi:hypothetical protein
MNRFNSVTSMCVATLLGISSLAGCGKSPSNETTTNTANATSSGQNPSTDAVVRAASNFLDAVIKGDTQRAGACLTPQAMQRIIASGKQFDPKGWENAMFRVGEVRTPSVDRAFVSFVWSNVAHGKPTNDEVVCAMRLVDNDWRVCGLAFWGPNQSVTEWNFETDQMKAIPRVPSSLNTASQPATPPSGSSSLPPRVATEPTSPGAY